MLREHPVVLEDLAAPGDPGVRVAPEVLEVQEVLVGPVERPHLFQEKLPNQLNPQRNQELPEVQVDRVVPVGQGDPVAREVREAQVVRGDREGLRHLVLEKRQSQPSQQRSRVNRVVREVPVDPVDPGDQEDQVVLEVPADREDQEVLEDRVVQEDPGVREVPQRNLQERQPRRPSQPGTHLASPMAPVDQEVRGDPEDPVVRVDPGDPVDQEDREVTYQKTLHLLNILNIHLLVNDLRRFFLLYINFSIQFKF